MKFISHIGLLSKIHDEIPLKAFGVAKKIITFK